MASLWKTETYTNSSRMSFLTIREHTATLLNDGTVLIAGGTSDTNPDSSQGELFNPTTATFTLTAPMATTRSSHTATLLNNGRVLLTGGGDNSGAVLKSAELYN